MKPEPLIFIKHIRDALAEIAQFVSGMDEKTFYKDAKTQKAVVRDLEIIGEAAKNVPDEFKTGHPQLEWKGIIGMRDVIVHQYFGLNLRRVWRVIASDLPKLTAQVKQILADPPHASAA